mgnify:CR=1 FL=1
MKLKQNISSWWQLLKSKAHILGKRPIVLLPGILQKANDRISAKGKAIARQ